MGNKKTSGLQMLLSLLLFIAAGLLFAGGFWLGSFLVGDRIIYGVRCAALDLSGLSRLAAERLVDRTYRRSFNKNAVTLVHDADFWQISSEDIELRLDAAATAAKAHSVGRAEPFPQNIITIVKAAFLKQRIAPVVVYSTEKLANKLAPIEEKFSREAKNAALSLGDGGAIIREPMATGLALGDEKWQRSLDARLKSLDYPQRITIEPVVAPPPITDDDLAPIDTVLGSFSLSYDNGSKLGRAIERAAKPLDKTFLAHGEAMSLSKDIYKIKSASKNNAAPADGGKKAESGAADDNGGKPADDNAAENSVEFYGLNDPDITARNIIASALYGAAGRAGLTIFARDPGDGEARLPGVPAPYTSFIVGGYELTLRNKLGHGVYFLTYAENGNLTIDILGCAADWADATVETDLETRVDPDDPAYAQFILRRRYRHGDKIILEEVLGDDRMLR